MIDHTDKCLALLFSLLILMQAYIVRRFVGTWLFPACLFGLFWFGYTFIPLAGLFSVPIEPHATGFILLSAIAFSVGSMPFSWKAAFKANSMKPHASSTVYDSSFLRGMFYFSTVASLIFLILNLSTQGISIHDIIFDMQESATRYANLLYSESLNDNYFDRLSTLFAYLGPILGGFVFWGIKKWTERFIIIILSILPAMLVALTQTSKGLLFLCIVLFYSGILVRRLSTGSHNLFEKGTFKSLIIAVFIVLPIVTAAFFLRNLNGIEDNDLLIEKLKYYYASYSCGHLYAFSDWFSSIIGHSSLLVYPKEAPTHGFFTFTSIFKMMGSQRVLPLGVFDDYYTYGNLLSSNIFTMFRGLILDFGIFGSLVFMFVASIGFHLAYKVLLINRKPVFTVAVFIFMMNFFYNSYIISVLSLNRMYAAFVLVWIVLLINKFINSSNDLKKNGLKCTNCYPALSNQR